MKIAILAPVLALLLVGCGGPARPELTLATTTSVYDSGLLDALLPDFEARYNVRVRVVAVGTGQAFELGRRGDADVLLVHDRAGEEAFLAAGYGSARYEVMYNDFILVGPEDDPAGIAGMESAAEALARIAERQAAFCSRGDDSGTHRREKALWEAAGLVPAGPWYLSLGQGMGDTLLVANEKGAYALSDRATYLSMQDRLPNLRLLVGGATLAENPDPALRNLYSLILVNPARYPHVRAELSRALAEWFTSPETREAIARFGRERYGQPLFYPPEK
ncbi:MAG: substrate-binding domain-containing protein [Chloroflexia bacterium]